MRRLAIGLLAAAGCAMPAAAQAASPVSLVDTRSGTLGAGFPQLAAGMPFGMISPGPDTVMPGDNHDPVNYVGYSYQDPEISGFSLTHFSGAGIHIGGDLPFMATTGAVTTANPLGNGSPFDHATEVAQPGYYAVTLARYNLRTEITASARAAMMRFSFPSGSQAGNVLADVSNSVDGAHNGTVTVVGDHGLQGSVLSNVGYRVYFAASFDRPFAGSGTVSGSSVNPGAASVSGSSAAAYVSFPAGSVVTMRVGISYVDAAGAERNLNAEIPAAKSFEAVKAAAQSSWDRRLSAVTVSGGSKPNQRTFYENLYRSLLVPAVLDDAGGRYPGMDHVTHTVTGGHHHYTDLSLWDSYRTQLPLLGLIAPRIDHDILVSLLDDASQNQGVVPRWVQANIDRGIMAGDSGSAALADGAASGLLTPAQARHALSLLLTQATTLPAVWPREHLDALLKYGYIPYNVDNIAPSLTEEYGIDDNAVMQLARGLGDQAGAAGLAPRAAFWRNLVDPSDHFIRPRNADGSWANPTAVGDPSGITPLPDQPVPVGSPMFQNGYQEQTGWQALWGVPQDVTGLAQAMGGTPVALRRLDTFFSTALNQPALPAITRAQQYSSFFGVYYIGNQYTPANEPDLWAPWYYDWYGQPWKAQKVARAEMAAYDSTPGGLPGNDDAGTMSAWYVLAALGLYHTTPGVNAWALSSPAFPDAVVHVGARTLELSAPGAGSLKPYVKAMSLNGQPVTRTYLTTCELRRGGTLKVSLGAFADHGWGTGPQAAPPSLGRPSAAVDGCTAAMLR